MARLYFIFVFCFLSLTASTQSIDGVFAFQTDPAKEYALYIPSSYDENTPTKLMLALHPFNVNRWDAKAWRDTLVNFAESNDLLLVCPDGGIDGKVDSPIDTAFTTTLLDSIDIWYNLDPEQKYIMGFSWGGKTAYTYGLRRTESFRGYLIIGPAVTIGEVSGIIENAKGGNFYLLNGSQDNLSIRYTPLLNALNANEACVESLILSGVGHTIDFPSRNNILYEAFQWLENSNCGTSSTQDLDTDLDVFPNPFTEYITIYGLENLKIELYDLNGNAIHYRTNGSQLYPSSEISGPLMLRIERGKNSITKLLFKH